MGIGTTEYAKKQIIEKLRDHKGELVDFRFFRLNMMIRHRESMCERKKPGN